MHLIQINQEFSGLRLDKFLCKKFDISFALAQKIIREKKTKVNGARVDASYRIQDSDQVEIFTDLENRLENQKKSPQISKNKMESFDSWIIFEDENLIAIDKPSGLAVQGGSGIDISIDDFITPKKYQLVHRLDKDTSGILLIAKNNKTAEFLTNSFKNKTIKKTYLALVCGVLKKTDGVINIALKKKFLGKNEKVLPDLIEGKEAITEFKLLKNFIDYSLLELKPLTGRTHQLRVHCKELGHPILNDVKYGGSKVLRKDICKRLCLHAFKIEIPNYFSTTLKIETELPEFC
ncbi:MAG: RluA family pseudouridine synthase [Rickettsiales bacterium]|nr:RluA family pseudouridine synthase [Rickettsiales bacterium]